MHTQSLQPWRHEHIFLDSAHEANERRIWWVVGVTAVMMVAEIAAGSVYGSMALTADGWHMSTHAAALAIAGVAYRVARRRSGDQRFSFGTGKIGELAAFSSALILAIVALLIGYESVVRLLSPAPIDFFEATLVAMLGLVVNLVSALLLSGGHDHGHHDQRRHHPHHDHDGHEHAGHAHHGHGDAHGHSHGGHGHGDTNFRAAYVHVLADALISVLAIGGLLAGRFLGWTWLDPAIGIVGAVVIAQWSYGLLRAAGRVLLDMTPDGALATAIRGRLESGDDRVADLHVWMLGPGHAGVIASVVSDEPLPPAAYKAKLADFDGLSHVTIEVNPCPHHHNRPLAA